MVLNPTAATSSHNLPLFPFSASMNTSTQQLLLRAATVAALPALLSAQLTQEPSTNLPVGEFTGQPIDTTPVYGSHTDSTTLDGAIIAVPTARTPILETYEDALPSISEDEFLEAQRPYIGTTISDRMHYDVRNGTHWVMGRSYKASAGKEGFTYMPFLGSDAPKTYGVTMRLGSATLGGDPIQLQKSIDLSREADRLVLDRGPIDVWYDMGLEAVEQSFALEASGIDAELVLTIDVQADLNFENQGDGIAFLNEYGGVTYDHAVVVDGAGKRLELPIEANADSITLSVPASFMKDSVAPVVVDPVLATYQVHAGYAKNLSEPDVAYDYSTDRFAFVHTSEFSATDHDVWMETRNPGGVLDNLVTVDFTTENVMTPMVANDNTSNQYLVTSRRENAGGYWEIIGRTVDATDIAQQSPVVLIGDAIASWENIRHDLGGKSQGASLFMSVWDREFPSSGYINSRRRTITPIVPFSTVTAPTMSSIMATSNSTLHNDTHTRISESSGTGAVAEWRVLYIREEIATGAQMVETLRYADDGTMAASVVGFNVDGTVSLDDLDVSTGVETVPGPNGGPTFAAPMMLVNGVTPDTWLYAFDGDTLFAGTRIKDSEHTNPLNRPRYPAVTVSANRFYVTYVEFSTTSPSLYTCYSTALDLSNTFDFGVIDRRVVVRELSAHDFKRPATTSRYDGGLYSSRYVACVVTDNDGTYDVQAAVTTSQGLGSMSATQFCQGNPNSTGDYSFITMTGTAGTSGTKTLRASVMPLNQFGYFLAGLGSNPVAPPGSSGIFCIGGAGFGRYNQGIEVFFTGTTGAATLDIYPASLRGPSGPIVAVAGQRWNFQGWHREDGGDSNFTNAVSIYFE